MRPGAGKSEVPYSFSYTSRSTASARTMYHVEPVSNKGVVPGRCRPEVEIHECHCASPPLALSQAHSRVYWSRVSGLRSPPDETPYSQFQNITSDRRPPAVVVRSHTHTRERYAVKA